MGGYIAHMHPINAALVPETCGVLYCLLGHAARDDETLHVARDCVPS
jgi:hypothetical protein